MLTIANIAKHISWKYATDVNDICDPLFSAFNVNYFDYARFYTDGTCIILYSDPMWVKTFLTEFPYEAPTNTVLSGPNLWSSYIPPAILSYASEKFNHMKGITFLNELPDYKEIINISTSKDNQFIDNFYVNQQNFIQQFAKYFQEKAQYLLKELEKSPLLLQQEKINQTTLSYEAQFAQFAHSLKQKGHTLNHFIDQHSYMYETGLTKREKECMQLVFQGLSAKHIARAMNISHRTVERNIDNIKAKFNCNTRIQLLALFNKNIEPKSSLILF